MTAAALKYPLKVGGRTGQKVRRNSMPKGAEARFYVPITPDRATKIMRGARRLASVTARPGERNPKKRWGVLHPTDIEVLEQMLFYAMDWASGRLDWSYDQLQRATGRCRQTIADALARLEACKILERMRRHELVDVGGGRSEVRQITNAYRAFLPERLLALLNIKTSPPPEDDQVRRDLRAKLEKEMVAQASGLGGALDALGRGVQLRESRIKGDSPVRMNPKGGSAG